MHLRSPWIAVSAALLASGLLAGCNSDNSSDSSSGSSGGKSDSSSSTQASSGATDGSGGGSASGGSGAKGGSGSTAGGGSAVNGEGGASNRCHTGDLKPYAVALPGDVNAELAFTLTNTSSHTCTVTGYVGIGLKGPNGNDVTVKRAAKPAPTTVPLKPGQVASAYLMYHGRRPVHGGQAGCVDDSTISFIPPNETRSVAAKILVRGASRSDTKPGSVGLCENDVTLTALGSGPGDA